MTPIVEPDIPPDHDYTEGASPLDIKNALDDNRRSRRDSQYSSMYGEDGQGAMFSGPGHSVNPTSVSRMAIQEAGRRSSDNWSRTRRKSRDSERASRHSRRSSKDSQVSRQTVEQAQSPEGEEFPSGDEHDDMTRHDESPQQRGVFGGLAHLFGRTATSAEVPPRNRSLSQFSFASTSRWSRRSRHSQRGDDYALETDEEDEVERWGYSSGEESDSAGSMAVAPDDSSITPSMEYDSDAPPPSEATYGIPLLTPDPVFGGEARIDMEIPFEPDKPPPPGPPSRQTIYIPDEDSTIRLVGYEPVVWRSFLWKICCVLSLGILGLLGHWLPRLWLRWVAKEKAFLNSTNGLVVIETTHRDITLFPVQSWMYPYPLKTVFPTSALLDQVNTSTAMSTNISLSVMNGLISEDNESLRRLLVIDYRYSRFALDPRTGLFYMIRDWRDQSIDTSASVQNGLDESVRQQRLKLFGNNEIEVEAKSTISLLVDEVIHPFYVFQIASIALWTIDDYYYYAFCIALISMTTIIATLLETKKTIKRMRDMSRFSCKTDVFIDGLCNEGVQRDSSNLVPGDLVNLTNSDFTTFPADFFLLSGDAIVNESMLTGESIPVTKVPMKDEDLLRWQDSRDENPKCTLYGGTKVVRVRGTIDANGSSRPALALVARTGFSTTKGALVRSMLYPRPIGFKFYRDSVRFICVLAGIAGLGFCYSAVQFVRLGVAWHVIVIRALDLITIVVPPALPATLSIGTSFAIGRLRKFGIFCISPSRVNVAGKINVCCFDKTGTLTEDGLDILGVRGLERNVQRFGELLEDIHDLPLGSGKATFLYALATCHSLKMVDGEVIGDPLDVKMFGFTGWTLEEGKLGGVVKNKRTTAEQTALVQTVVRPPGGAKFKLEDALKGSAKACLLYLYLYIVVDIYQHAHFLELGVIRTFEFVSSLRRMSVIVKRLKSSSMEIYVKGAPEVMVDICDRDSFPEDYDDLLSYYTKRGYRVIAIAGKSVEGLSWLKAQRMKREQAESGLQFLGLIIFENRLKPGTTPAIQALRTAHLACRMITGDNPLTAVSVARECSLINPAAHVFSPAFIRGNENTAASKLEWSCTDDLSWKLDSYSLKPLPPPPHHTVEADEINYQDYSLVVTGDVFRWMINHAPLETLQRMLVKTQIFARMSPDEKNEVVERLQSLGYTVLMCGDGANDCSALKAADVGISLSEAEASVAAPFTSSTPDVGCVLEVIKQGRALYSLIQFTTVTLLYSFASILGDFQFLYIDLFIIIPVAVAMGRTLPYPRIHPKPPTASLVSKKVLASIIGQILISSGTQLWVYLWVRQQTWYTPPPTQSPGNDDDLEVNNYENTVLFLVSCFQYILVAAVFSIGPPYRKSMWTNGWLMLSVGALTAFNMVVLLVPPEIIAEKLNLMALTSSARLTLLLTVAINVVVSVVFEQWGSGWIAGLVGSLNKLQRGRRRNANLVRALPLRARQDGATTVQTVHTTQTSAGLLTETCVITFTPITDSNGESAVQEVKKCTLAYDNSSASGTSATAVTAGNTVPPSSSFTSREISTTTPTATPTTSSTPNSEATASPSAAGGIIVNGISVVSSVPTQSATSTSSSAVSSASSVAGIIVNGISTVTGVPSPAAATTSPSAASSASSPAGIIVNGISTVTSVPTQTAVSTSSSSAPSGSSVAGIIVNGISSVTSVPAQTAASASPSSVPSGSSVAGIIVNGVSTVTGVATPTGTSGPSTAASAAADTNSTDAAAPSASASASSAFELPGTKLSVLPIGLGVFAGISVIALIVVGLVTYERTKYRRAFRQRKLAESGAAMGYGGMAVVSPDNKSLVRNVMAMKVPVDKIGRVITSHWHRDHTGGLLSFLDYRRTFAPQSPCVVDVHPDRPLARGIAPGPNFDKVICSLPEDPTFELIENAGGIVEKGRDGHAVAGSTVWQHIMDERYAAIDVVGKGLTYIHGYSHEFLFGKSTLKNLQVIGGLHLAGPEFSSRVPQTVEFLSQQLRPAPTYILPMHCSGFQSKIALEDAFGEGCVPAGVGLKVNVMGDHQQEKNMFPPVY
ncbi:hypothetical protein H0H92_009957 [Tricholoma furcatifolium]|nr:hypothetical protein H0H92_009957 [Tricholoma furcatifolium]